MLYRITEIEINGNDRMEYSRISDEYEVSVENRDYILRCQNVNVSDVTLPELQVAIERQLEGENYHSSIRFVDIMIRQISKVVGQQTAKTILWNMIDSHGMSIGLRG